MREQLNILVVADIDKIVGDHPDLSQDLTDPTVVSNDAVFMMCHAPRGNVTGQGTFDIGFKAFPGDYIRFFGASFDGDSDTNVLVYGIQSTAPTDPALFNGFRLVSITRPDAIVADASKVNFPYGLPATTETRTFSSLNSVIMNSGVGDFSVYFAVFNRDSSNGSPVMQGYCQIDIKISINS